MIILKDLGVGQIVHGVRKQVISKKPLGFEFMTTKVSEIRGDHIFLENEGIVISPQNWFTEKEPAMNLFQERKKEKINALKKKHAEELKLLENQID